MKNHTQLSYQRLSQYIDRCLVRKVVNYLRNIQLKAELWSIIVVENWPERVLFQRLIDFPGNYSHLSNVEQSVNRLLTINQQTVKMFRQPLHCRITYLCREARFTRAFLVFPCCWVNVSSSKTGSLYKDRP